MTATRWAALLGVLAIAFFVYQSIEFRSSRDDAPSRPVGSVADIEALAQRSDVNVLLVLVDTLRSHRMSLYGYERDTTPFLRALADTSVTFDRHIAQSSWTKSSMASLWSGLNPLRVGITKFDHTVSHDLEMAAEILEDEGFLNVAMYRNGWVHGYFGFDQGFSKYYRPIGRRQRTREAVAPNEISHGTDETMAAEAEEFFRFHGNTSRWFLYLHMMDLHEYVYDEESALFGTHTSDLYDNSIRRVDWLVSLLFTSLHKFDLLDKTIVVLLSDHGEAFGERGFEGHAREVLPETTETPFMIVLPFALEGGVRVASPTSNTDVWATILDLLGLPLPGGQIDGRSRRPEILAAAAGRRGVGEGALPDDSEAIISYLDQNWGQNVTVVDPAVSVVLGDYRFVAGRRGDGQPFEALFSTGDDQRRNLLGDEPEIGERLRAIATAHLETEADFRVESVEMDEMQLDQLRALGYKLP